MKKKGVLVNLFNIWERIKTKILNMVKSRMFIVIIAFCLLFSLLVQRLFTLQIVNGEDYLNKYKLQIQKTKEVQGTRGRILDRNGKVLAENVLAYSITMEDNGDYDTTAQKNEALNNIILQVVDIVEKHGDSIISSFGIILDDSGNYTYATEGTRRLRFIADVFGESSTKDLSEKQQNYTADELMNYLCTDSRYGYGIDQEKYSKEKVLQLVNIRYAVGLNRFQKYISTTIATNVNEETVAEIMENQADLTGISIEETSMRQYPNSEYFASIIGYTGQISQEEYDALSKEDQKQYSTTDIVGKAGLEKSLDKTLQGGKGEVKLYVNNVGKVVDRVKVSDAKAGNDVYLSIDADLQIAAYNILEEKLAGLILLKLQNTLTLDRSNITNTENIPIPIGDVYNAFFQNELLNTGEFTDSDAGSTEKAVAALYAQEREQAISSIMNELNNTQASAHSRLSDTMQAYLEYIINTMLMENAGIIVEEDIDTSDKTYQAWAKEDSISAREYLNYAISKNWIDTSKLTDYMSKQEDYSDSSEIFQGILNYVQEALQSNRGFEKLIYKNMIQNGILSGTRVCLLLYEQGVLEYDETAYRQLSSGSISAYNFMRNKIENLEITPGELGLEPSTGSIVITDTNNGQVLAMISYPGYDNNKLANSMDSSYFAQLSSSSASPMYNKATQEKTAPGSTYKPLVAVAGLTEGVISTGTQITCGNVFKKITPSPKCWIHPGSHGSLNVEGAIEHSCNIFFYETGYRMSLSQSDLSKAKNGTDGTSLKINNNQGLATLQKYASMFGLDSKTGIEIPEAENKISDQDAVRSSIGQGTNNYTTVGLARYINAIANKGTVFNLSLVDKITDVEGNVIQEYQPEVLNQIEGVSNSTWNAVHNGMRRVVTNERYTYNVLEKNNFQLSGKTGTAQQSKIHPDHGLFVGYAPSNDPEIAFAIRIANGYASLYPSEVGRDIMRYYYNIGDKQDVVTGHAASVGLNTSGD